MATYTGTPRTWTAGETVTAALLNSDVRDPLAALAGAWTSYTPTITGFTLGNGTTSGAYLQVGKLVIFRAGLLFGSTSAAAAAACTFTLPVTASSAASTAWWLMGGYATDSSTGSAWSLAVRMATTSTVSAFLKGTSALLSNFSTTSPMTWATSDTIAVAGVYEAA